MSWKAMNFDWNRARAFLVVAETGSLSAAAKALETTQPTMGRQIAALEAELGVTLFERFAHGLELTESGMQLLESVRSMGQAAVDLSLRATGQAQQLEGRVCISSSELHAVHYLPPILKKLQQQEPGIDVDILVSNDVSNLKARDADIAIRSFRPNQPDLIVRKLKEEAIRLYAAVNYPQTLSADMSMEALKDTVLVGYEQSESMLGSFRNKSLPFELANLKFCSQSYMMQMAMIRSGLGIGMLPESNGDSDPGLVRVLEHLGELMRVPIWLVVHRELHTNLRVRRVFDLIVSEMSD